jgi:hypothetical protein
MDFRYLDGDGKEQTITTTAGLVDAMRRGDVTAGTLVFDQKGKRWVRAEDQEDFAAISNAPRAAGDVESGSQLKKDRRSGWLMFAAGVIGIFAVGALVGLNAERIGYAFGQALFLGVVCAALVQFVLRRNRAVESAGRVYLGGGIAFLVACASVLALQVREHSQEQSTLRAVQARVDAAMVPGAELTEEPTEALPTGLYGTQGAALLKIMDTAQARGAQVNAEYMSVVEGLAVETLLSPHTVTSVEGRRDGRARLQRWREALDRLETAQRANEDLTIGEIEKSGDLSPGTKAETIKGVRNSRITSTTREFMQVQREVAALTDEVYTFMDTRTGAVGVEDDTVAFEDEADIARYNAFIERLGTLIERENESVKRQQAAMTEASKEIQKLGGNQLQ